MACTAVVFISGRGSNLHALLENQGAYAVASVLSNKPEAPGLTTAAKMGVPVFSVARSEVSSIAEQKSLLYEHASSFQPDLILLAGYMQIIEAEFIAKHAGKILNIHPSLLPNFPGLKPHQQAIDAGAKEHGCTVHLVTEEVDSGEILAQAKCEVLQDDTAESLGSRVLELEHRLYPWVVSSVATGDISFREGGGVNYSEKVRQEAEEKGFVLS